MIYCSTGSAQRALHLANIKGPTVGVLGVEILTNFSGNHELWRIIAHIEPVKDAKFRSFLTFPAFLPSLLIFRKFQLLSDYSTPRSSGSRDGNRHGHEALTPPCPHRALQWQVRRH